MRPLPFSEPPAEIAFAAALVVFFVVQAISGRGFLRRSAGREGAGRYDRGSLALVLIAAALGIALGIIASTKVPGATIAAGDSFVRYLVFAVGILLMLLGSAFRLWAVLALGRSFTLDVRVSSDQEIVSSGPYRYLRHPSYTGLLVSLAGWALALGNWLSVIIVVVMSTAGLIWRIFIEESALMTQLGDPYRQFAAKRKRLIPGIW